MDENALNNSLSDEVKYLLRDIEAFNFRKKNRPGNGAFIGALVGGVGVGLIAMASQPNDSCGGFGCVDFSAGEYFLGGFLLGVLPGAIAGYIIGSKKTTIPIGGSLDSYQKQLKELELYKRRL